MDLVNPVPRERIEEIKPPFRFVFRSPYGLNFSGEKIAVNTIHRVVHKVIHKGAKNAACVSVSVSVSVSARVSARGVRFVEFMRVRSDFESA